MLHFNDALSYRKVFKQDILSICRTYRAIESLVSLDGTGQCMLAFLALILIVETP